MCQIVKNLIKQFCSFVDKPCLEINKLEEVVMDKVESFVNTSVVPVA